MGSITTVQNMGRDKIKIDSFILNEFKNEKMKQWLYLGKPYRFGIGEKISEDKRNSRHMLRNKEF